MEAVAKTLNFELQRGHGQHKSIQNGVRQRLPALHRQGGEEGSHEGRGACHHPLTNRVVMPSVAHRQRRYGTTGRRTLTNRRVSARGECDVSNPLATAQRFVEVYGIIASHFRPDATYSPPLITDASVGNDSKFGTKLPGTLLSPSPGWAAWSALGFYNRRKLTVPLELISPNLSSGPFSKELPVRA
jgi:hypothetical protein